MRPLFYTFIPVLVATLHLLAGCQHVPGKYDGAVTPDEILSSRGAPETGTLESAVLKSAEDAVKDKKYTRAAQLYEQLVQRVPTNESYQLNYAEMARRAGWYAKAKDAYDAFLKKHSEHVMALEGKGLCLLALGEVDEAKTVLEKVVTQDGGRWHTLNGLGILASMKEQYDVALKYYRDALNASENNPAVLNNLGLTLAIREDYPKAIRSLELARKFVGPEREVDGKRIGLNLAMVYGISGDMEKAEETAKPYLSESELYNNLGHYAYLADKKDLAQTYLNMALTSSKDYYETAWKNLKKIREGGN